MPRLAQSLMRRARQESPLLLCLLRECRDLRSARNELRWLKEYAIDQIAVAARGRRRSRSTRRQHRQQPFSHSRDHTLTRPPLRPWPAAVEEIGWRSLLRRLVERRARGEPLQYILGTQPFGELEILCRKHVLVPRPETEAYTYQLAMLVRDRLQDNQKRAGRKTLRILDVCTGTGCISLLLHSLLKPVAASSSHSPPASGKGGPDDGVFAAVELQILGVDISPPALKLAAENLRHNVKKQLLRASAMQEVAFAKADLMGQSTVPPRISADELQGGPVAPTWSGSIKTVPSLQELLRHHHDKLNAAWDILIANPPYISPRQFAPGGTTVRSVRRWEPQLALVPEAWSHSRHTTHTKSGTQATPQMSELERGDEFYVPLFSLAKDISAQVVVVEVGDDLQAMRIKRLAEEQFGGPANGVVELWRDDGSVDSRDNSGGSEARAIVIWRSTWGEWRKRRAGEE